MYCLLFSIETLTYLFQQNNQPEAKLLSLCFFCLGVTALVTVYLP